MHEAQDSDFVPSTSSTQQVLVVAGVLAVLMLLICGGVSSYVALTASPEGENQPPANAVPPSRESVDPIQQATRNLLEAKEIPLTQDPAVIREIAATIIDIDLPAGLEPIEAEHTQVARVAVFESKTENSALLKLVNVEMPFGIQNQATGSQTADPTLVWQALKAAEDGRINLALRATKKKLGSKQRQLTVLGKGAVFEFRQGKRALNNKPVWKIWGGFATTSGVAALIYLVPDADFDEEAIVRMIESIRPAPDAASDGDKK